MFLRWVKCVVSCLFLFSLLLSQCYGEPFAPQSQPTARWRSPVQLPNHMAGVCRGSGFLEGFAVDLCHRFAVSWHCLLCEWGAPLRGKPARTGALKELMGDEADRCLFPGFQCFSVSQNCSLSARQWGLYIFSFCIFTYCNPFRTMCSQGYCILKLPLTQPDFLGKPTHSLVW